MEIVSCLGFAISFGGFTLFSLNCIFFCLWVCCHITLWFCCYVLLGSTSFLFLFESCCLFCLMSSLLEGFLTASCFLDPCSSLYYFMLLCLALTHWCSQIYRIFYFHSCIL